MSNFTHLFNERQFNQDFIVQKTVEDSLSVSLVDTKSTQSVSVNRTDILSPSLSDAAIIYAILSISDTCIINVTDTKLSFFFAFSDTLLTNITDTTSLLATLNKHDTVLIAIAEEGSAKLPAPDLTCVQDGNAIKWNWTWAA